MTGGRAPRAIPERGLSPPPSSRRRGHRDGIWAAVVAGVAFVWFGHGLGATDPFPDESSFIAQAFTFDLLVAGEVDHPSWLADPAVDQPPLEKFLAGLALWAGGHRRPGPAAARAWHANTDLRVGTVAMRRAARWPSAILGAVGCAAIFGLGTLAGDRRVGLASALLLMGNPLYRQQARRAVGDVPSEALLLAGLALGLWGWRRALAGRLGPRAGIPAALGCGTLIGLATLTKLNVGIGVVILALWAALAAALTRVPRGRRAAAVGSSALAGLTALATFVALNPTLTARPTAPLDSDQEALARQGPVGRLVALAGHRMAVSARQQRGYPRYALPTSSEKFKATLIQGFGRFGPFGPLIPHAPVRYDWVQDKGAVAWFPWVVAGAMWATVRGLRQTRAGEPPTAWAVLIQALVAAAGVVAYVPMAWDRYFLPLQAGSALLAAGVAVALVDRLASWRGMARRGEES